MDGKYEHTNPIEKLHPGEPYFFLRAQDIHAPGAVRDYAKRLGSAGDYRGEQECLASAVRIESWQRENPELVKEPD